MTREMKRRYLEVASACAVCALAFTPGFAQTTPGSGTSSPGRQQSAPAESRPGMGSDTQGRDVQRGMESQQKGEEQPRYGHSGQSAGSARIRQVQEALKSEGQDPGPIDGVMAPKTQRALRDYQRQENLPATGRLDQKTLDKLGLQASSRQQS
jgi:peptidoglycan hydrolase-like protein with peptidoglycan-binding domain